MEGHTMTSRKFGDLKLSLIGIGITIILIFIVVALTHLHRGTVTSPNTGEKFTTSPSSDSEETGKTYFTYHANSKRKYVNFLNTLDKEKYEIFAVSHSRYTFFVTYRLKNHSSLEKVTGSVNSPNDLILYYTGSKDDYLNFLETLDAEKYAIFDVCQGDICFYVTYFEKN